MVFADSQKEDDTVSHYKHLSIAERESLYLGVNQGKSIRTIARELKRSASSLSRELRRNKISHRPYSPSRAQRRYQRCKKNCGRKPILANQEKLQLIRRLLREEWSPEQIQYRLKHEKNPLQISYTTIYRALSSGQIDGCSPSYIRKCDRYSFHLRRKGKKRKENGKTNKQGKYEIQYSIFERPQAAEQRSELGHWEGDTVVGRKGGARFLTQADRKSRLLLAAKVPNGTAEAVRDALIQMFDPLPAEKLRSITSDRGHEFAKHSEVSDALRGVPFYFADPYSPWQRGTNENTNGLLRQYFPKETSFDDVIYGKITAPNDELDDMILIKSDGYPTYNFANVIDDHLMEITHVVRGNEYLSSAPKYNRLYEAFGWEVPVYVHCPLITDENHQKLSKRCGHSSFEDLVEQGFLTEAIVNFVALLGWSPADNQEIMTLEELVEKFDYHHMNKSPAVFDYTKLKWMNGEYIKKMDFDKFYEMALPYIKEVITKDYDLKKIAHMVQTRIEIFPDIRDHIDFFEELPEYDVAMYTHKKMKTNAQTSLEVLQEILPVLEAQEDYSNDALYQTLLKYVEQKGCKNGYVMWPIRTAVSGKQMTPAGATEIMEVLGKEESLARIRKGIELLQANV